MFNIGAEMQMGFTCPICLGENVRVTPHGWGQCPDCGADEIDLPFFNPTEESEE